MMKWWQWSSRNWVESVVFAPKILQQNGTVCQVIQAVTFLPSSWRSPTTFEKVTNHHPKKVTTWITWCKNCFLHLFGGAFHGGFHGRFCFGDKKHYFKRPLIKQVWSTVEKKYRKENLATVSRGDFHQTFQVPKMEVLTYISCMDTAYVRESPSPKQPNIRFRKPSILGTWNSWWHLGVSE